MKVKEMESEGPKAFSGLQLPKDGLGDNIFSEGPDPRSTKMIFLVRL